MELEADNAGITEILEKRAYRNYFSTTTHTEQHSCDIVYPGGVVVVLSVEHQTLNCDVVGSTLSQALLHSNLGQVVYTCLPLSPSSIIWNWLKVGDDLRLGK